MPFKRIYDLQEVKGMLSIYRGNHAITGVVNHVLQRAPAAAHANLHAGASFLEQRSRVNTPGEPRKTGTYWNEDDQAKASMELLNSVAGQNELGKLDTQPITSITISGPLTPNRYKISVAQDASTATLTRNSPQRTNAGSTESQSYATTGFIKVVKGVGSTLQIQTSFPS